MVGYALAFIEAIRSRERWTPSEWAERAPRIIPDNGLNPEPGAFNGSRTPYMREIIDTTERPGVEMVVFRKPTQVGWTTAFENLVGYWADLDPGAAMIVEPDEKSAREVLTERVLPTFRATPALARHLSRAPWDTKTTSIKLDTMPIFTAWAGSPMRLAMWPIRRIFFDEPDKYPAFSGREAGPIELGLKRISNWGHRAVALIGGTPTVRSAPVMVWWDRCSDHRQLWVQCHACSKYQVLSWSRVKWPAKSDPMYTERERHDRAIRADRVHRDKLAYYECEHCKAPIRDEHKPRMLASARWASDDQVVNERGEVVGPRPSATRVGFHLNSLYSPWVKFSALAAEWLLAQDNPAAMMDFRNSRLAEPFEERASAMRIDVIREKAALAGPPMVVPQWAALLIATADVQKDHLYWLIRAWGAGMKSCLVQYGMASDFDDLDRRVFETPLQSFDGGRVFCQILGIDSRHRQDEVLRYAERRPGVAIPIQGSTNINAPPIQERAVKGYANVIRVTANPHYWNDVLHGLVTSDDKMLWLPHNAVGDDYCQHMAGQHKILDHARGAWVWTAVSSGTPDHFRDCEKLQCLLAQRMGVSAISSQEHAHSRGHQPQVTEQYMGRRIW